MKSLFQNIIYNDIYNLLLSLHLLYNIDLELLTKIYMPNIIFNDPPKTKIIHRKIITMYRTLLGRKKLC